MRRRPAQSAAPSPGVPVTISTSRAARLPHALVEREGADRGDPGARRVRKGDVEEKVAALWDDDRGDAQDRRSMQGKPGVAKGDRIGRNGVDALGTASGAAP